MADVRLDLTDGVVACLTAADASVASLTVVDEPTVSLLLADEPARDLPDDIYADLYSDVYSATMPGGQLTISDTAAAALVVADARS